MRIIRNDTAITLSQYVRATQEV